MSSSIRFERRSFSLWDHLLFLYILTLPFFGFSLLNVGERGVARLDWLVGLGLIALFVLESLTGRLRVILTSASLWVFFYICSGLISAVNVLGNTQTAQFIDYATKGIQLLIVTPLFFVISSLPFGENQLRHLLRVWIFLGFAVAIHTIYQLIGQVFDLPLTSFTLTNPSILQGGVSARVLFGYTQPTSIFREPSYLGAFLGPCFLIAAITLFNNRAQLFFYRRNWMNWLMVITIALAILLSNSQAILASLIITLLALFISGTVRRRRIVRIIVVTLVGLLLAGVLLRLLGIDFLEAFEYRFQYLIMNILEPVGTTQVTSFADRRIGIEVGLAIWRTHPLLGVGLGNMAYYSDTRAVTNNAWVQLLVEQGLLGVATLGAAFLALLYELAQRWKCHRAHPFWGTLTTSMFFVTILTGIDGNFTFNWTDPLRVFVLAIANLVLIQATVIERKGKR